MQTTTTASARARRFAADRTFRPGLCALVGGALFCLLTGLVWGRL